MIKLPTEPSRPATSVKDYICMFYGPPGGGKSTFVNSFGRVLFLSTDRGTRFLNTTRHECFTWNDFEDVLEALQARGAPKYDFVCIDHVDDWASIAENFVCEREKISSLGEAAYGKGWKSFRNLLESYVRDIMALNTGVVFIAHEDIKNIKSRNMEVQRLMPSMGKSAWKVIVPLADIIGYITPRTVKGPDGKFKEVRIIDTEPKEDLEAKDRTLRKRPAGEYELLDGASFMATFGGEVKSNGKIESSSNSSTRARPQENRPSRASRASA